MRIRTGYVSNSSSSSFVVDHDVSGIVPCVKLTEEIARAVIANHRGYEGETLDFPPGSDLWLTGFIWDGEEAALDAVVSEGGRFYMEGHGDCYEYDDFYVVFSDGRGGEVVLLADDLASLEAGEIPNPARIRDEVRRIIGLDSLDDSQKISAISHLMDEI